MNRKTISNTTKPGTVAKPIAKSGGAAMERFPLLKELFGIDLRSVAFFRITLALSLLADLFMRSVDIEAFYTDIGVVPRSLMHHLWNGTFVFTFHSIANTPFTVGLLFAINALVLILLLIGWQTRPISIIAWLFLISLQSRNTLILQGGDVLLRCLAFWAIFLPLGEYLAWDAKKKYLPVLPGENPAKPVHAFSWATVAIILQTAFVYWFTALLKNDPIWWQTGYAIYVALNIDLLTKPLGQYLANVPFVAYILTFVTIYMEGFGPFFAFFPLWNGPIRTATVFAFWIFHLVALQSMMYLGPFPWTCALAWTVFLPAFFWDKLALWWNKGRDNGLRKRLSIFAAEYIPTREIPTASEPKPKKPVRLGLILPANILAAFYLLIMIVWNFRTVNFGTFVHWLPVSMNGIAELPHIDQCWDMFSPRPMTDDGWYIIAGNLRDGSKIDLMPYLAEQGAPTKLSWEKPKDVGAQFRDERWRKYFLNMWPSHNKDYRAFLASYISLRWNRSHSGAKQLCTFDIYYMREDTPPQYAPIPKAVPVLLWHQWCFDEFAPKEEKSKQILHRLSPSIGKSAGNQQTGGQ